MEEQGDKDERSVRSAVSRDRLPVMLRGVDALCGSGL